MKLFNIFLTLGITQGVLADVVQRWDNNNGCNDDNCARAVTGTRPGKTPDVASRRADCSSFMEITVIPATVTVTSTATVTDTITEKLLPNKRWDNPGPTTIRPTNVPTYASACSGTARYSSACSCWGITACTTTEPTPSATVYTTVTVTTSVCPWGSSQCQDGCHDLNNGHDNCGKCGNKCQEHEECKNGKCVQKHDHQQEQCHNPTVCGGQNGCGQDNKCFCHPDSYGKGFCHPNDSCDKFKSCTCNEDCDWDSVCVSNCCSEKKCRKVQKECENQQHPKFMGRLFRKQSGEWTDGTPS